MYTTKEKGLLKNLFTSFKIRHITKYQMNPVGIQKNKNTQIELSSKTATENVIYTKE